MTDTTTTVPPPVVVPVSNPGLATLMKEADKITHVLQAVVSYIPMVAGLPVVGSVVAPIVPFVPVAQTILNALDKIESANGDVSAIFTEGQKIVEAIKVALAHPKGP